MGCKQVSEYHVPVLINEVLAGLNLKNNSTYVDGTLGGAGHSTKILEAGDNIKLIAFDRDSEAINYSKAKLERFNSRVTFVNQNYKTIVEYLNNLNIKVDGVLLDLGVSSHQLDETKRGFSYKQDSPLDMRMSQSDKLTAEIIVNEYSKEQLANIIYNYGEERLSRQIADEIIKSRPLKTTYELKEAVLRCANRFNRKEAQSCVQRVFQAIRIEVNDELTGLYDLIVSLPSVVNKGGRIAIISFHSLEDRIVKQAFNELSTNCICPPQLPVCVCNHRAKGKLINKKPIIASEEELKNNTRSKSAKLRVLEVL